MKRHTCVIMLCFLSLCLCAERPVVPQGKGMAVGEDERVSDLWYFQLTGPVKHIELWGIRHLSAQFNPYGHVTRMVYGEERCTIHRNDAGRIDSITTASGRVDDFTDARYRLRATDERGNWMARKTTRNPYTITTELCSTEYYDLP